MNLHWASIREAGARSGMAFMVWANSALGRGFFGFLLAPISCYYFLRRGQARKASIDYLHHVRRQFPGKPHKQPIWWWSLRHIYAFGQSLLDKYLVWTEPEPDITISRQTEAVLSQAMASRRGCLLIGSHYGNLEYSRGISRRHPELILNVLTYDQHATKFTGLVADAEPDSRMNLIQVTDVDLPLAMRLKQKVDAGEWVVIAGDRTPVGSSARVAWAPFIGQSAPFPVGPYVLASLLGCPVYLLHCYRKKQRYQLEVEPFEERIHISGSNKQAEYEARAARFSGALEKLVERDPLQWFNFYDFWGGDNPAERNK